MTFASYASACKPARTRARILLSGVSLLAVASALTTSCSASDVAPAGASGGSSGALGQAGQPDLGAPPTCTSQQTWMNGDNGSELMHPGRACLDCHAQNDGPNLALAGTVFPSAHEPDECNGVGVGRAVVVITDAKGVEHRLNVNAAGNFKLEGHVALPYHAHVEAHGLMRAMVSPQSAGDCNGCHTQRGEEGAPGRIVAP